MSPHPPKLREEAVRLREQGLTHEEIAERLGVGSSTVDGWVATNRTSRAEQQEDLEALDPPWLTMPPPWQEPEASAERRRLGGAGIALVVAGIIALAVLWALALNSLSGDRYGARVDLLYLPDGTVSLDVQERVLGTQAAILRSRAVLEPVAAQSGVPLGDLEGGVSVKMGLSNVLEVTVTAPNRRTARALAQAIADRYVQLANRLPNGPTMRVLSPAFSLSEPVSPRPSRVVAWGLLVVFQTAIVVALWLRRRQRRRRDE